MGITFLKLKIVNPAQPKRAKNVVMLVDSGAVYSVLPADELKSLGIKPTSKCEFMLANGESITMPIGNAEFHFRDRWGAAPVVFGVKDVRVVGSTTFSSLRLMFDPIHRQLAPLPMFLMSALCGKDAA